MTIQIKYHDSDWWREFKPFHQMELQMNRLIILGVGDSISTQLAEIQRTGAWLNGPPIVPKQRKGGKHEAVKPINVRGGKSPQKPLAATHSPAAL